MASEILVNTDSGNDLLPGGRFKNTYELLNLRALKMSMLYKNHIFQCMGKTFCVEFQRVPIYAICNIYISKSQPFLLGDNELIELETRTGKRNCVCYTEEISA